jgi:hypothetical protein
MIERADGLEESSHSSLVRRVQRASLDLAVERLPRGGEPVLVPSGDRDSVAVACEPPRGLKADARGSPTMTTLDAVADRVGSCW